MRKPQGYTHSAAEEVFCVLVLCLPCYQSLWFAGFTRAILALSLALLLMFLVVRATDFCRSMAVSLVASLSFWINPVRDRRFRTISLASLPIPSAPSLSPLFQRPPPIFS